MADKREGVGLWSSERVHEDEDGGCRFLVGLAFIEKLPVALSHIASLLNELNEFWRTYHQTMARFVPSATNSRPITAH